VVRPLAEQIWGVEMGNNQKDVNWGQGRPITTRFSPGVFNQK